MRYSARHIEDSARLYLAQLLARAHFIFCENKIARTTWVQTVVPAVVGVSFATICAGFIAPNVHIHNTGILFLFVVFWLALFYGRSTALFAAVLSFLTDDAIILPRKNTLFPNNYWDWVSPSLLLTLSVVVGYVTAQLRSREHAAVVGHKESEGARADLLARNLELEDLVQMRQQMSDQELLTNAVMAAGEEERRRISRELHDATSQSLTVLLLGLQALAARCVEAGGTPEDRMFLQIGRLQQIAQAMQSEIHTLAIQLRPTALDDLGLVAALESHVEHWVAITGMEMDFQCVGLADTRLPAPVEVTLYRVIQEALSNVVKHAHAARVSLVIERRTAHVVSIIEDDGTGFDAQSVWDSVSMTGRLGLLGMRERVRSAGGTITIESTQGQGTAVFVSVPLATRKDTDAGETARLASG